MGATLLDGDGGGHAPKSCGGDFNDSNPDAFPGAAEICDGADNDGDDGIDEEPAASNACGGSTCQAGACPGCTDERDGVTLGWALETTSAPRSDVDGRASDRSNAGARQQSAAVPPPDAT